MKQNTILLLILILVLFLFSSCEFNDGDSDLNESEEDNQTCSAEQNIDAPSNAVVSSGFTLEGGAWISSNVSEDDEITVCLSFDKNWIVEAVGEFRAGGGFARVIVSPDRRDGIDWFWCSGESLCMRLSNRKIYFSWDVRKGSVSNPYPGTCNYDHVAGTVEGLGLSGAGNHTLRVEYVHDTQRMRVYVDSVVVGDYGFIKVNTPSPIRKIKAERFSGEFKYSISNVTMI